MGATLRRIRLNETMGNVAKKNHETLQKSRKRRCKMGVCNALLILLTLQFRRCRMSKHNICNVSCRRFTVARTSIVAYYNVTRNLFPPFATLFATSQFVLLCCSQRRNIFPSIMFHRISLSFCDHVYTRLFYLQVFIHFS